MSKFFVGQRVRVVRATHAANNGITGRISRIQNYKVGDRLPSGQFLGPGHNYDCWLILDAKRHDGQMAGCSAFWQIEPILPEGSAPSEYTFQQLMDNLQEVMA
ncbi:TPA: hypothetical protein ACXJLS_000374 [Stenotrophomonas maltophilia]